MSLLTAFTAVVLLAASGQAAWAQGTVSFSQTTGVIKENAPVAERFQVTVTRSATSVNPVSIVLEMYPAPTDPGNRRNLRLDNFGISVAHGGNLSFNGQNQAVLTIWQDTEVNPDWRSDERLTVKLQAPAGTTIGPDLVVTTQDAWTQPRLSLTTRSMRLTEKSRANTSLIVSVPRGSNPPDYSGLDTGYCSRAVIQVDPPDAIGTLNAAGNAVARPGLITLTAGSMRLGDDITNEIVPVDRVPVALGGTGTPIPKVPGRFFVPYHVVQLASGAQPLTITANPDTSGFKNQTVTITPVGEVMNPSNRDCVNPDTAHNGRGALLSGPPLVIEIISDEPTPTVYFSPTDISINEGGSTTAALVAEGPQGKEVNTVGIAVDGDALVDLYRGDAKLEPANGVIRLDLKDTNLAQLRAQSTSDRSLLDGQTKSKTWRIVDADGAKIDADANRFAVTVKGSTAVPALPLVAQLLLALFLTAGGARLYRRRRPSPTN